MDDDFFSEEFSVSSGFAVLTKMELVDESLEDAWLKKKGKIIFKLYLDLGQVASSQSFLATKVLKY